MQAQIDAGKSFIDQKEKETETKQKKGRNKSAMEILSSNPAGIRSLNRLRWKVQKHWCEWLGRRTQKGRLNWSAFNRLLTNYPLISPKIVHSYRTHSESII